MVCIILPAAIACPPEPPSTAPLVINRRMSDYFWFQLHSESPVFSLLLVTFSKYSLKKIINVEENHDVVKGDRYLIELVSPFYLGSGMTNFCVSRFQV